MPAAAAKRLTIAIAAGAFALGAVFAGVAVWSLTSREPPAVVRTAIATSGLTALTLSGGDRDIAITPDGSRVVYASGNQLLLRRLDQLEPALLSSGLGVPAPRGLFMSSDGQWVGFFERNIALKKIPITGGPAIPVFEAPNGSASRGATWSKDGTIIFATLSPATGLQRVTAAGGEATVLTVPSRERGEGDHFWPEFLPGGKAVLFTITPDDGNVGNAEIAVLDLESGTSKILLRGGSDARYVPTGHLVYAAGGALRAVAFDRERLAVIGTPVVAVDSVAMTGHGGANIALSSDGSIVYIPGAAGHRQAITWLDRRGQASTLPALLPGSFHDVHVSPDGSRLAIATTTDIWIYDVSRASLSRLTTDVASDSTPLWSPDGQRVVFTSTRSGYPELFWKPADGSGRDERLLSRGRDVVELRAMGWWPDGSRLLFTEQTANRQRALWQAPANQPAEATLLLNASTYPAISPNGRWIAFESTVSGRPEIYVERFPELGERRQISTDGGRIPLWSPDGRELYFSAYTTQEMFAVAVSAGTKFAFAPPRALFQFPMFLSAGTRAYDAAPDGRFLAIRSGQADTNLGTVSTIIVVQNWTEELKRLVPIR
jgi:serine/threonine-protein kinase